VNGCSEDYDRLDVRQLDSEDDRAGSLFGTVFAECDRTLTVQILEADPA
jgi:hypothetical protein